MSTGIPEVKPTRKLETAEDLDIWQKVHSITLEVMKSVKAYPISEWSGLAQRTKNAALDVPVLIERGFKKRNFREKMEFYIKAAEALDELKYLLKMADQLGYTKKTNPLYPQIEESAAMFTGLIKAMEKRTATQPVRNREFSREDLPHDGSQESAAEV
ncbi:MAG: four helix bundle protein [Bacteroidetes bacterium]|nr:four helix bundle protein [Bacteroidota bacterium]